MTALLDRKIQATALWYIRKTRASSTVLHHTLLGAAHKELALRTDLQAGELPIVSFFISEASWYLLTTRRIVGMFFGRAVNVLAAEITAQRFVALNEFNLKETAVMLLKTGEGIEQLEYETGIAAMAPIYYLRYWKLKFPILHKMKPFGSGQ